MLAFVLWNTYTKPALKEGAVLSLLQFRYFSRQNILCFTSHHFFAKLCLEDLPFASGVTSFS